MGSIGLHQRSCMERATGKAWLVNKTILIVDPDAATRHAIVEQCAFILFDE